MLLVTVATMLAVVLAGPALVVAQTATTGALVGTVKDSAGAVVPGATIRVTSNSTGLLVRSVVTDKVGGFVCALLTPGSYRLEAELAGFQTAMHRLVAVQVTETSRIDVTLEVGGLETTVEVTGRAPLVNRDSATVGATLGEQAIQSLPLVNRNYYQLLSLAPGTTSDLSQAGTALGRGVTDIQVSGQRSASLNVQIMGVNVNDFEAPTTDKIPLPNPDFLQEFKVSTSLYDATQGRSGGVVNVVVKSGQSDLHGNLFDFLRNEALNANTVFLKARGRPKPTLRENQFGGSTGGKAPFGGLFFFTGYQGTRGENGLVGGISTGLPILPASRNASTLGDAFGLDPNRVDPVAVNILNLSSDRFGGGFLIPTLPGTPGSVAPFAASDAGRFRSDQWTLRLDRNWGSGGLIGTVFFDDWQTKLPLGSTGFGPSERDNVRNIFTAVTWTHVFGSRMTNQVRVGYNRIADTVVSGNFFSTGEIGMNSPNAGAFPGLPQFVVSGFLNVGGPDPNSLRIQNNSSIADDFTYVAGGHTFRVGGSLDQYRFDRTAASFGIGRLDFGPRTDPVTRRSLTSMQAFLLGMPTTVRLARAGDFGIPGSFEFRASDFSGYFQDDWAVSPRLKLNLGLRFESLEAPNDALANRISVFDLPDYAAGGVGFKLPEAFNLAGLAGTPGVESCGVAACRHNEWAPRVGLAYDVFGTGNTVVRSGYGIYFHRFSQQPTLVAAGGPPFSATGGLSSNLVGLTEAFSIVPLPVAVRPTEQPRFVGLTPTECRGGNCFSFPAGWGTPQPLAPDFHPPRVHQWNLTVGQELGGGFGAEIAYVGSRGTSLIDRINANQPRRASPENPVQAFGQTITTNRVNNAWLRAPLLGLDPGRVRLTGNSATSSYHALQLSVRRRTAPMMMVVGYTWSKSIDDGSGGANRTDRLFRGGRAGQELSLLGGTNDQTNLDLQRAVSDFDRTHRLTVAYVVDLPALVRDDASGLAKAILNGWSLSGVSVFQSGTPYSVFDSGGGAAFGAGPSGFTLSMANSARPGPIRVSNDPNQYLNAADFAQAGLAPGGGPGDTDFGTLGRNIFRSPFQQIWDLALVKKFSVGRESRDVEFRASIFNLWNQPVFDVPDNGFTNVRSIDPVLLAAGRPQPNFGVARSTVTPPRIVQLSLRFTF